MYTPIEMDRDGQHSSTNRQMLAGLQQSPETVDVLGVSFELYRLNN